MNLSHKFDNTKKIIYNIAINNKKENIFLKTYFIKLIKLSIIIYIQLQVVHKVISGITF